MRASTTTIELTSKSSFRQANGQLVLIAGPCSAETEEQMLNTAMQLKNVNGISVFKAGIWKSRTRPNSFEGVGTIGLGWLQKVKQETGLKTACDVVNAQQAQEALQHGIDILCISGRATVNPFAVQELAEVLRGTDVPVLVNNPVYTDLRLWLGALERLHQAGITDLGAIHRGFAIDEQHPYRNHPKWEHMLELKSLLPELPILCDTSHIAGKRSLLYPVSQRAVELGADGMLFESHVNPAEALSSQQQQLMPQELDLLINAVVTKVKLAETTEMVDELDKLSQQIGSLDDELMELLLRRTAVTKKLGSQGGLSSVPLQQAGKWQQQLESLLQQNQLPGLNTELVQTVANALQQHDLTPQSDLGKSVA
ncbi:3-deoxy-7-phosphoheptulonate synthase [Pontibacter cellulosilyticus]|uniref:chorismate mutase n=1 Tax=Pontibacter cellulosilyticus TaxID=1720253 RepID=A0A923SL99_9BACT|nr:3-deoxy-7-phosphoheptulonate synthase [Pontibacter cellulosilyticus]MBC5994646.1 3-deoxy-7-phosphoheptulonate synthase [Pontibacter cellulosilyticus]